MKRWAVGAIALAQVLVLAFMAAERESVVRTGRILHLRTAPVDPRDPFRGDYVRLSYDMSLVATNRADSDLLERLRAQPESRSDLRVYAVLDVDERANANFVRLTDRRPETGVFIRGRTRTRGGWALDVRYGLEAYFVEQNRGKQIEQGRIREDIRVPLSMEVAVAPSGLAVLRSHRWEPMGMGLRLVTVSNRIAQAAFVRIMNASSNDVAVVDLPGGQSLSLEPDRFRRWWAEDWSWVGRQAQRPVLADSHVVLLPPGGVHEIHVDLTRREWFVTDGRHAPQPIGGLGWSPQFRFVYRAPTAAECAHLPRAHLIWHGELLSPAFSGGGRVD